MKELIPGIVSRIPDLMEHTTLSVSLCGWRAAIVIGLVCGTIVAMLDRYAHPETTDSLAAVDTIKSV